MIKGEFENVEIFLLLDWFVIDFDSKFVSHLFKGDYEVVQQTLNALDRGQKMRARMSKRVQKIAKKLKLDIGRQTFYTKIINGIWSNVTYLSFGTEARELIDTCAIRFIDKILKSKIAIQTPSLRFKIFYHPPIPVAITDRGIIMYPLTGFTNKKTKRIEINVYSPRDYKSIFKHLVHEVCHVYLLQEPIMEDTKYIESKVDECTKKFFDKCKYEWISERPRIIEDLENTIEKKLSVFREADCALDEFHKDLTKARSSIKAFKEFNEAVADGKVKAIQL